MYPVRTALALLVLATAALPARAQAPLTRVDRSTSVASIAFPGAETFREPLLQEVVELVAPPPLTGIRRKLGFQVGVYPFDPVTVKKDATRLREYYVRNGFPRVAVRDSVRLDTARNAVDIWFLVEEGPILEIGDVTFGGPSLTDAAAQLPPSLRPEWAGFTRQVALERGARLDDASLSRLRTEVARWLGNRGYAFAYVGAESFRDSTGLRADVRLKILAGPRATIDEIVVEGAESVADGVVRRELPFSVGDLFSFDQLGEGRRELFALGLFQLAIVDLTEGQTQDSTVSITVRVEEGPPGGLGGFAGYFQEGGLTARARATHRNVFGGARSLTATAEARTGIAGTATTGGGRPITDLQASVLFLQPYVLDRRVSLTVQPLVRRRDDRVENSRQAELSTSLVYASEALRTAALTASVSRRTLLSVADSIVTLYEPALLLAPDGSTSDPDRVSIGVDALSLGLSGTFGRVDDTLLPRRGVIVSPAVQFTGGPLSTFSYGRARVTATGFLPLGRFDATVRLTAGSLRLLGSTNRDDFGDYISLRDVAFYAGGTNDVRGWAEGQLGPKVVDILLVTAAFPGTIDVLRVDCETPEAPVPGAEPRCPPDVPGTFGIGGEAKVSGSVQVTVPAVLSVFGFAAGLDLFLDGGRVSAGTRVYDGVFDGEALAPFREILASEGGFRFGTGAGLSVRTPVGAVSVGVGFKVNPSYLDSRDAQDVAEAILLLDEGFDIDFDDPDVVGLKRFGGRPQFYLSIGQSF